MQASVFGSVAVLISGFDEGEMKWVGCVVRMECGLCVYCLYVCTVCSGLRFVAGA